MKIKFSVRYERMAVWALLTPVFVPDSRDFKFGLQILNNILYVRVQVLKSVGDKRRG